MNSPNGSNILNRILAKNHLSSVEAAKLFYTRSLRFKGATAVLIVALSFFGFSTYAHAYENQLLQGLTSTATQVTALSAFDTLALPAVQRTPLKKPSLAAISISLSAMTESIKNAVMDGREHATLPPIAVTTNFFGDSLSGVSNVLTALAPHITQIAETDHATINTSPSVIPAVAIDIAPTLYPTVVETTGAAVVVKPAPPLLPQISQTFFVDSFSSLGISLGAVPVIAISEAPTLKPMTIPKMDSLVKPILAAADSAWYQGILDAASSLGERLSTGPSKPVPAVSVAQSLKARITAPAVQRSVTLQRASQNFFTETLSQFQASVLAKTTLAE